MQSVARQIKRPRHFMLPSRIEQHLAFLCHSDRLRMSHSITWRSDRGRSKAHLLGRLLLALGDPAPGTAAVVPLALCLFRDVRLAFIFGDPAPGTTAVVPLALRLLRDLRIVFILGNSAPGTTAVVPLALRLFRDVRLAFIFGDPAPCTTTVVPLALVNLGIALLEVEARVSRNFFLVPE
ncbi:hypothetical protein CC79DRAFT_815849 [Sarocladium strictum]